MCLAPDANLRMFRWWALLGGAAWLAQRCSLIANAAAVERLSMVRLANPTPGGLLYTFSS